MPARIVNDRRLYLFDSHCHLNFTDFDIDRARVLKEAAGVGVRQMVIPATRQSEWRRLLKQPLTEPVNILIALGLHPYFVAEHSVTAIIELDQLLAKRQSFIDTPIVAVGETGLDFFNKTITQQQKEQQLSLFKHHVKLAVKHELPLIIHSRKSHDEVLQVLRYFQPGRGGIIHAFSGSEQQAHQYIKLGFKLGFGGGITYERAKKTRHLAATLALKHIVLETDAPDMPLFGYQGKRNEPKQVRRVAQCLAQLKGLSLQEVAETTAHNCETLLGLQRL